MSPSRAHGHPATSELTARTRPGGGGHLALRAAGDRGKGWGLKTRPSHYSGKEHGNSTDQARPSTLPSSPRDPQNSPVSALSQIPGLRCLELVAKVEAGVESVGVDRHALLTPPAPEGKEGPRCRAARGLPSSRELRAAPAACRAAGFAPLPKL